MTGFFAISLIVIGLILAISVQGQQIADFRLKDYNTTSMAFTWTNPLIYDSLLLNYMLIETGETKSVPLGKNVNTYQLDKLAPGTTVKANISTIVNAVVAHTTTTQTFNTIPDVITISKNESTSDSITLTFKLPLGFYDNVTLYCVAVDDPTVYGEDFVEFGEDSVLTCNYLYPGTVYDIIVISNSGNEQSISNYTYQTELDVAQLDISEIPGGNVNVAWTPPDKYDTLYLNFTLVSTKSTKFFTNTSIQRSQCKIGRSFTYTSLIDEEQNFQVIFTNACPLSTFLVNMITNKNGFKSKNVQEIFETKYQNVDCNKILNSTIGDKTNITWSKPEMNVENYLIKIYNSSSSNQAIVYAKNVTSAVNSIEALGLGNNLDYKFEIGVYNQKYFSIKCNYSFTTDAPCPSFDDENEVLFVMAPYVDEVYIQIPPNVFKDNINLITNVTIIVGIQNDCLNSFGGPNCYIAATYDTETFYEKIVTESKYQLSKEASCSSNLNCSIQFKMDVNYFITVNAKGPCGSIYSNTVLINIPSPFPIGTAIGITIGCVVAFLIILLAIVLVVTFRFIKKKHHDDLTQLIDEEKLTKFENNDGLELNRKQFEVSAI